MFHKTHADSKRSLKSDTAIPSSYYSIHQSVQRVHKMKMNQCQIRVDTTETRSAMRQKLVHHNNTLRTLIFTTLLIMTAHGSASPMTLFATPSHLRLKRSLPTKRAGQFDYRNTHQKSSMKESALNGQTTRRNSKSTMSKIKSPSNSYTQFYKEGVLVGIESTSHNSRRISGEIIIEGIPIDDIWNILTDYDNLSTHVPNLVESKVINNNNRKTPGRRRPRVYQRGAQRIFGFEFGADVTMDMAEHVHHDNDNSNADSKMYSIDFKCVDSQFFSEFDGSWILEEYSVNKTMVRYIVDVKPKGPVPVAALEWRIKEDVPVNILAVSKSARESGAGRKMEEKRPLLSRREDGPTPGTDRMNQMASIDRVPQASTTSRQPRSTNPLQHLTDQATQNLKQISKSFLPSPMYSTARQALKAMNNSNPMTRTQQGSPRRKVVPLMSLDDIRRNKNRLKDDIHRKKNSLKETIVDWYEDETMATYLKDP
mmetsp:Transcript_30107/g.56872  ORF Transcript_30107/g.56872 Transcript_30107/m.56872 type:complete len:482 (-) Transcript_30107:93-1538(-)